jgi:hypothetical protein
MGMVYWIWLWVWIWFLSVEKLSITREISPKRFFTHPLKMGFPSRVVVEAGRP